MENASKIFICPTKRHNYKQLTVKFASFVARFGNESMCEELKEQFLKIFMQPHVL